MEVKSKRKRLPSIRGMKSRLFLKLGTQDPTARLVRYKSTEGLMTRKKTEPVLAPCLLGDATFAEIVSGLKQSDPSLFLIPIGPSHKHRECVEKLKVVGKDLKGYVESSGTSRIFVYHEQWREALTSPKLIWDYSLFPQIMKVIQIIQELVRPEKIIEQKRQPLSKIGDGFDEPIENSINVLKFNRKMQKRKQTKDEDEINFGLIIRRKLSSFSESGVTGISMAETTFSDDSFDGDEFDEPNVKSTAI